MAITTTVVAGYRYGASIPSNVLEILPKSNVLYFAIMLVTLQLCLSSAVGTSPLFQHIEDRLKIPKSNKNSSFKMFGQDFRARHLNLLFFS